MSATTYTWTLIARDGVHLVTRVKGYPYVCDRCGIEGSPRWALMHLFPGIKLSIDH